MNKKHIKKIILFFRYNFMVMKGHKMYECCENLKFRGHYLKN